MLTQLRQQFTRQFIRATVILTALSYSCKPSGPAQENALKQGLWRAVIHTQGQEIPFLLEVGQSAEGKTVAYLINGSERILLDEVQQKGDSLHLPMHVFDTGISARLEGDRLNGYWERYDASDYRLAFEAVYGVGDRFPLPEKSPEANFSGKWRTYFLTGSDSSEAIGVFGQDGHQLDGTFLTKSGDYRFLSGVVNGRSMALSTFDGSHAYLFKAAMEDNGTLVGEFWSGKTGYRKWFAYRDEAAELPDAYSLTRLTPSGDPMQFRFPNADSVMISLDDERYRGVPVVVEIMGTWCPNCMDESRFLAEWYAANAERGVEIIGLAFERKEDFAYGAERIRRAVEKLGIGYEVLFAGSTAEESRSKALPMIEKLASYPTTIFLDREHRIVKVHAGFSGPGTGVYYEQFVEEFNETMDELIGDRLP